MNGSVHVILGAGGGIGSELCRRLAARGARLLLGGRNPEKLSALAAETGGEPFPLDATDAAQIDALFARAVELHGRVDGAANCVGSIVLKPAHLTPPEEFAQVVATNLGTAFNTVRSAARAMMNNPAADGMAGGSIVLVSTVAARVGLANHEAIAAAKAGVQGLALSAAATYAKNAVRVNVVAPGLTRTPLSARLTSNEAALKASVAMHPLGRLGEPADVAAAIEFLLDPAHSWVTGQVLGVDGGLATVRPRG
jgi:NAD(P)-dependent dehydrogenase (short-subunit alcohol dehydrogenase family)